jgi:predicted O-methyltransferase YrrM
MSSKTNQLDDAMRSWMHTHALRESAAMTSLRASTATLEDSEMQTSPEQLQFLSLLAKSVGTTNAIEVGVYTGASALAIAESLGNNGTLIACDLTDEYLPIAVSAWEEGGVIDRIDMKVGPAIETLTTLLDDPRCGTFDFMYIDADKTNSQNYYELGLKLLRAGGIITIDNMFYGGQVADDSCDDESTVATRVLAALMLDDDRIDYSIVPIGDGLAIARIRT